MTVQTAIQVVGEDVVGSLQCAPSMESMSDPALTSLLNFRTTSSESQPPSRMPKERRRRGQRDDYASAERRDEALERPLPPIRLRLLFWIDARTERQGVGTLVLTGDGVVDDPESSAVSASAAPTPREMCSKEGQVPPVQQAREAVVRYLLS